MQKTEIEKPVNTPTVIRQHQTDICILVVEDDPEMQSFISSQLGNAYSVMNASNGKEALKILSENTISLVVSDVMMPEMNGYETTKAIRNLSGRPDGKKIPIIAMTANAFQDDIRDCIDAGMNAHIAKPIDIKTILAVFDQVFGV